MTTVVLFMLHLTPATHRTEMLYVDDVAKVIMYCYCIDFTQPYIQLNEVN